MQHAGANQKLVAWNDVATSRKKERDVLDVKLTLAIDSINRPSETSFGIYSPRSRRCKCCVSKLFIQDATESKSNPLSHTGLWNTCCQCSNLYLLVGPSSDLAAQAKLLCVWWCQSLIEQAGSWPYDKLVALDAIAACGVSGEAVDSRHSTILDQHQTVQGALLCKYPQKRGW